MNVSYRSKVDLRWYLAVRCNKCQVPILFGLDRAEGAEDRPPPLTEKLVLTCTLESCKHRGNYTTAAVLRIQKPPGPAHKPNKDN